MSYRGIFHVVKLYPKMRANIKVNNGLRKEITWTAS
ncbi:MAG: hypothetical protein ACJASM_001838 [Salibacteraceae bacterium]|jgi:hypothetical protein